jgi:phage host-nuclease inhibitor protein Gam
MGVYTRFKLTDIAVPQTAKEADALLGEIATIQGELKKRHDTLSASIAKLKADDASETAKLEQLRTNRIVALHTYAHPRKSQLTQKAKTIRCTSGEFGWRLPTPTVLTKLTDKALILWLKANRKPRYVRMVEEVDRERLLKDRPDIPGLTYTPSDEFFVKPKFNGSQKTLTLAIDR